VSSSQSDILDTAASASSATVGRIRTLDDRLSLVGIRMILVALSFFFACFYFALTYLQLVNSNNLWRPSSLQHPAFILGFAEMALILLGGLVYFGAQVRGLYKGNYGLLTMGLLVTAVLSLISVILHVGELHNPGFTLQDGGYASVFIGLEGVYTFFLVITTVVLFGLANRSRLGRFRQSGIAVDTFGEFWGWMSAIALLNFMALYVQPFFPIS